MIDEQGLADFIGYMDQEDPALMARCRQHAAEEGVTLEEWLVEAARLFIVEYTRLVGCPCWRCSNVEPALN